jgi:hypothetical protein
MIMSDIYYNIPVTINIPVVIDGEEVSSETNLKNMIESKVYEEMESLGIGSYKINNETEQYENLNKYKVTICADIVFGVDVVAKSKEDAEEMACDLAYTAVETINKSKNVGIINYSVNEISI